MKLTLKQKQFLVAIADTMEMNFSSFNDFHENAADDDFFNIVNEDDIRRVFNGKSVSGIMSALSKKGIFIEDCAWETKLVKKGRVLELRDIKIPLWRFLNKDVFADDYNIRQGDSLDDALIRMRIEIQQEAA